MFITPKATISLSLVVASPLPTDDYENSSVTTESAKGTPTGQGGAYGCNSVSLRRTPQTVPKSKTAPAGSTNALGLSAPTLLVAFSLCILPRLAIGLLQARLKWKRALEAQRARRQRGRNRPRFLGGKPDSEPVLRAFLKERDPWSDTSRSLLTQSHPPFHRTEKQIMQEVRYENAKRSGGADHGLSIYVRIRRCICPDTANSPVNPIEARRAMLAARAARLSQRAPFTAGTSVAPDASGTGPGRQPSYTFSLLYTFTGGADGGESSGAVVLDQKGTSTARRAWEVACP
jgi:hypothetical protein